MVVHLETCPNKDSRVERYKFSPEDVTNPESLDLIPETIIDIDKYTSSIQPNCIPSFSGDKVVILTYTGRSFS
jgi:hypothetical protein